jgi:hypothetical protein
MEQDYFSIDAILAENQVSTMKYNTTLATQRSNNTSENTMHV